MIQFIALGVGQGDAFYIRTPGVSILVDGGKSRDAFVRQFENDTKAKSVDVAICTHNDADHANGIIECVKCQLCKEIWLPGNWIAPLSKVLKPFDEVVENLIEDISQLDKSHEIPCTLEEYSGTSGAENAESTRHDYRFDANGWADQHIPLLEASEMWQCSTVGHNLPFADEYFKYWGLTRNCRLLLQSAISAAERIRAIAQYAFHTGIRVTWLEYDVNHNGLEPYRYDEIIPVNSRPLAHSCSSKMSLLSLLALTVSNRKSLVFAFKPKSTSRHLPGVLFTADSDLSGLDGKLSHLSLEHALVTAPHHGSEENEKAYGMINRLSRCNIWVRSDGRFNARPGASYLRQPTRFCIMCRLKRNCFCPKQAVKLEIRDGRWSQFDGTQPCKCG